MKLALIHGQNHKGSSYHVGRLLAEQIAGDGEIAEFFLPCDLDHFCSGCCRCLEDEANCPWYAEKRPILDAIDAADVLIFTTPTYCLRASAPMKSFIDLTFIRWLPHRPKACMFSKKAVVVSTAAGAGMRSAMKDVVTCLRYWGVPYVRTLGFAVASMDWQGVTDEKKKRIEAKARRLAKKVASAKVRVGLKTRLLFRLMGMGVRQNTEGPLHADYLYWQQNGWLDGKRPY